MENGKSFEERLAKHKAGTVTSKDIAEGLRIIQRHQGLVDENGVYKPNVSIEDYQDLFPDIELTKEFLEAYENADVGFGDMKLNVSIPTNPLVPDKDGFYRVPIQIQMPGFIKGNKDLEATWTEIFSNKDILNNISTSTSLDIAKDQIDAFNHRMDFSMKKLKLTEEDMVFKPPFIDYDCVQQIYPTMHLAEANHPSINNIGRGYFEPRQWIDPVAFLGYDCYFIRERINLIKTRKTKHGKRKLIPYKVSKVLFKNVKPISAGEHISSVDVSDPLEIEFKFSYSD